MKALIIPAIFLLTTAPLAAEGFLKPNDRVVFLGDSITAQNLYTKYIENYYTAFHPGMPLEFINAGVGGDQSGWAVKRVEKDVLAHRPTVVTICFGMNDAGYRPTVNKEALEKFKDGLVKIINALRENSDARIVLLTTTCVDEKVRPELKGYNRTLSRFVLETEKIGKSEGLAVINLYRPMKTALAKGQAANPAYTLVPDGVHPNEAGHLVMAETILRAWGER